MIAYIFVALWSIMLVGLGYHAFISPRKWMKQHGEGNYNPLRQTYKNASQTFDSLEDKRIEARGRLSELTNV